MMRKHRVVLAGPNSHLQSEYEPKVYMKTNTKTKTGGRKAPLETRRTGAPGQLKIRSILVPVDFSEPSLKALRFAALFAKQFSAKLTLLNVVETTGTPDFMAAFPIVMENDKLVELAEEHLTKTAGKLGISDMVEKVLVRCGVPYYEVTSAARTLKTDLIMIATQGHTGLTHLLLGSTTERVVRHASCPVYVVR
jgi:universal stress protein A